MNTIAGHLEVGCDMKGDVVVQNIPENTGHIVFSPDQARTFGEIILYHAYKRCDCFDDEFASGPVL